MIELGLQRISRLLAKTPLRWRAIHVAGTNGKGSICAYISSMLDAYNNYHSVRDSRSSYIRHGRFTSPHLVDRWDCITINQQPVRSSVFHDVEKELLEKNRREAIGASEFELLTATAFEIFNRERVDVGVVEVGMGGRLDATNVIGQSDGSEIGDVFDYRPPPLVSAISRIGLDHQHFLGNTLGEIAREKAGIIKPGVPIMYDSSNDDLVVNVIQKVAAENGCPIGTAQFARTGRWSFPELVSLDHYPISINEHFRPTHMVRNLEVAFHSTWLALLQLQSRELAAQSARNPALIQNLAEEMVQAARRTVFPGRQQPVRIEKLTGRREKVLLDGAHNAQSAVALASAVEILRNEQKRNRPSITWVIAASSSKDAKEILSPLLKPGDAAYAVEFGPVDGMPWVKPMSSATLLEAANAVISEPDGLYMKDCGTNVSHALKAASEHAAGGPMVIAGSLYLVGDVLRLLRES